jgi:hypothetical protein
LTNSSSAVASGCWSSRPCYVVLCASYTGELISMIHVSPSPSPHPHPHPLSMSTKDQAFVQPPTTWSIHPRPDFYLPILFWRLYTTLHWLPAMSLRYHDWFASLRYDLKNIIAIVMGLTELYLPKPRLFLSVSSVCLAFLPTLLVLHSSSSHLIINFNPWNIPHGLDYIPFSAFDHASYDFALIVIPFNSFFFHMNNG